MISILITIVVLALVIYVIQLLVTDQRLRNILIAVVVVLVILYLIGDYNGLRFYR